MQPAFYLASRSPRRRELLTQIRAPYCVLDVPVVPGEDEPRLAGETPADYVARTAREKALRGAHWRDQTGLAPLPVLGADTTVILGTDTLGKPKDRDEAARMLRRLSGTRHEVRTAMALAHPGGLHEAVSVTWVEFRPLSERDIAAYCDSGEPYDKAGAYGIQGLAAVFVTHLSGSYTGVMGLPLYETAQLLGHIGISLP